MAEIKTVKDWFCRPVFYVRNAESALAFYTEKLGFRVNWNHKEGGRAFVCEMARNGLQLILAQNAPEGRSRVFISLDDEQVRALRAEIAEKNIVAKDSHWGMPVIEILDLDRNELLFSFPGEEQAPRQRP